MINKYDSVPKLNLEPKLKRPLSLWNPLDYLRLFYWILFFPQALRWYIDKFGGGYVANNPKANANFNSWRAEWKKIRQDSIQFRLFIQGLLIATSIPVIIALCRLLKYTDLPVSLNWANQFNVSFSFLMSVWMGLFYAVSGGVALSVVSTTPFAISIGIINNNSLAMGTGMNMTTVLAGGFALGIGILVISGLRSGIIPSIAGCFIQGGAIGLLWIVVFSIISNGIREFDLFSKIVGCLLFAFAFQISVLRIDCWLISLLVNFRIHNRNWFLAHTTLLPPPFLTGQLRNWLRHDWNQGLDNVDRLLRYTLQFIPVVRAVNKVLAEMPSEQIIYRISQLTKVFDSWRLIYFISASLKQELTKSMFSFRDWFDNKSLSQNLITSKLRTNTPARAIAAGFWYLHDRQPDKAAEAFAKVRCLRLASQSLLYGEEVYTLAKTLAIFQSANELEQIASLDLPTFPQGDLLRDSTWKTLYKLRQVVEEVKTIQISVSHTTKALASNRAIGELTGVLDAPEVLLEAEKELIIEIAQNWKRSLERIAKDIGNIVVTKPISNPYVIGDPVQGSLFAGREDIMRQLEELWSGDRLQSVVLFGHRRMGKTSILLNIDSYIDADIKIAYINLLRLGDSSQGVGEVLMQICDGIAEVTGILPPDDDVLLKLPYRSFERYIRQVEQAENGLIIAIDEFEKIEELIELQRIPTNFLGFLRGIVQMNPRIALIFAGLHTLEEMTADYFQPFFASVIPLHVGFLNAASTRQILANPTDVVSIGSSEFMLDYTPQALDLIYFLTAGQPYLIQLIGFQLVRRYNQQMFERGKTRNLLFAVENVTEIVDREFFQRGRYYFEGVWGQAAQNVGGQQEIIKALAPYPQGLPEVELITQIQIDETTAQNAIAVLQRHDVIVQTDTGWQIIVELFRLWVDRS